MGPKGAFVSKITDKEQFLTDNPGAIFFRSDDGKAGGYLLPSGYIGGLFNDGAPRGTGAAILDHMLEITGENAHLDHYGGRLDNIYGARPQLQERVRYPFDAEAAGPDWDTDLLGEPDYVKRGAFPEDQL